MNLAFPQTRRSGFSLVEITLALGIASFTLLAIMGLLPVGIGSNQSASEQSMATNIASAVIADMGAAEKTTAATSVVTPVYQITVPAANTTAAASYTSFFDESSTKVTDFVNTSTNPTAPANARYRVIITSQPVSTTSTSNATNRRIARVGTVTVYWPAAATTANALGSLTTFYALDRQ